MLSLTDVCKFKTLWVQSLIHFSLHDLQSSQHTSPPAYSLPDFSVGKLSGAGGPGACSLYSTADHCVQHTVKTDWEQKRNTQGLACYVGPHPSPVGQFSEISQILPPRQPNSVSSFYLKCPVPGPHTNCSHASSLKCPPSRL